MINRRDRIIILAVVFLLVLYEVAVISYIKNSEQPQESIPADSEMLVVVRYATEEEEKQRDIDTINDLAQTVWGEARGCPTTEQAAVIWCVLNRVDSPEFPNDPLMVVQQKNQFSGYDPSNPIEQELVDLVIDVMDRWEFEKTAVGSVGRVLPKEYTYFYGDGIHNHFRDEYIGGNTWDWSLNSPYEEEQK